MTITIDGEELARAIRDATPGEIRDHLLHNITGWRWPSDHEWRLRELERRVMGRQLK
jgi:hypothetical protein